VLQASGVIGLEVSAENIELHCATRLQD